MKLAFRRREVTLLLIVGCILLVLWLLGLGTSYTLGGFINVAHAIAMMVVVIWLSARIFRVGTLMTGKRSTFAEIPRLARFPIRGSAVFTVCLSHSEYRASKKGRIEGAKGEIKKVAGKPMHEKLWKKLESAVSVWIDDSIIEQERGCILLDALAVEGWA